MSDEVVDEIGFADFSIELQISIVFVIVALIALQFAVLSVVRYSLRLNSRTRTKYDERFKILAKFDVIRVNNDGTFTPFSMPLHFAVRELLVREHNRQGGTTRLLVPEDQRNENLVKKVFPEPVTVQQTYSDKLVDV